MADNVTLNSGSGGATAAADDIGGIHYQRVKPSLGADGSATDAIGISAALDSAGTGIQAVGLVAQLDDASTATVTENQFAPVRLSSRRALLVEGVASGTAIPVTESGSATSAKQDTLIGHVDGIEALLTTIDADTGNISTKIDTVAGAVSGTEMQVDVLTSALPSGASTSAKQDTMITSLAALEGTVRAEDAASAGGHTGIVVMARRTDTPAAQSGTDGDYEFIQVTGGRLAATTTVTGTVTVDGSGVTQPVSHAALTELAAAIDTEVQCDIVGAIPAGNNNIGDVDVASIVPGTGATNLGKAEDAVHSTGDVGVMILGVRQDSQADFGADGDYVPLSIDADGAVRVSGGGGGTQYTEDAAAAADPVGNVNILVRKDTPAATVSADGDNIAQRGSDYGAAYVTLIDNAGAFVSVGGGTQYDEDTAHVSGDKLNMAGVVRADTAAAQSGTDGDRTVLITDANGRLHVNVGNTVTVGSHAVTNAGTFAVQVDGSALTALQLIDNPVKQEDDASANADSGFVILAKRLDTPANSSGTDGDYEQLQMSAGRLWTSTTVTSLPASTNTIEVVGDIAHDTGVSGNPVQVAAAAQDMDDTAPPNRVSAESDTTRLASCRDGAVFVHPHGPQVWSYHSDGSSALTDATVHAAPGAGLSLYVTDIVVSTGAATALNVFFEEGASKVLGPYYLEAVAGRGLALHFQTPKKITANTALTVTTSAAIAQCVDVTGFTAQG